MIEIFKLSILFTLGIIASLIVFGLLIGYIERKSNSLIYGSLGKGGIIFTGIIGTTVHEFSHFIMCKLFLHKVTDVKWFSLNINNGGELGYVRHSYNLKSIYQRIGNFFIGVAPVLIGTFILIIAYKFLMRDSFNEFIKTINFKNYLELDKDFSIINFLNYIILEFKNIMESLFTLQNIKTLNFWIFMLIATSVSTHMSLSKADLKNSLDGIGFIFLFSVILGILFFIFKVSFSKAVTIVCVFNIIIISFLSIGLLFSFITFLIVKLISFCL